jgi:hypothetical protein
MRKSIFNVKIKRDRKAEAIARLKMRWEAENEGEEWEPEKEPIVTPALKDYGLGEVIDALRMHSDEDARAFVEEYERCNSTDRKLLPLEYIAFAAGIGSLRLAEVAQTATYLYASMRTKFIISGAMPKVTNSIIKAATDQVPIVADTLEGRIVVGHTNGDVKAMEIFGRMSGIVPVPKGAQIAIQNNFGEKEEKDAPAGWKDSGERLREFHDMTEPKRLPSPETKPINLGGHLDRMQEETIHILRGE